MLFCAEKSDDRVVGLIWNGNVGCKGKVGETACCGVADASLKGRQKVHEGNDDPVMLDDCFRMLRVKRSDC